ncbi:MAG: MarR family transcriptional regulator [Novosphingobium sp.]|nr:MarR family transcriptional regulator [Novosphingobium sp.]
MSSMRDANIAGALAVAISDAVTRAAEAAAPEPGPAAAALMLVAHLPGMSIDALRIGVGLSHPGAVRLVDRLAGRGLIARRASKEDRRRVALHLTAAGETMAARIADGRLMAVAQALDALPDAERTAFIQTTEKLLAGLVAGPDDAIRVCRLCDETVCTRCPVDICLGGTGD